MPMQSVEHESVPDRRLPITRFANERDNTGNPRTGTWEQVTKLFAKRDIRQDKSGKAFSPAIFNGTRAKTNTKTISMAVADIDNGTTLDEFRPAITSFSWVAYSSHSHTPEHWKFRIVFPLVRNCMPEEWAQVWEGLNLLLGGHCDTACKDSSRLYFLPSCPAETAQDAFYEVNEGLPLDPDELKIFGAGSVTKQPRMATNAFAAALEGTPEQPYPFAENREDFYSALCTAYPDPRTRMDWRPGNTALAYLVVNHGWPEDEARKIRIAWENSATGGRQEGNEADWKDALKRTVERLKNGEDVTRHLSILKAARAAGWEPKQDNTTPDSGKVLALNNLYAWIEKEAGIYRIKYADFITVEKFHAQYLNDCIDVTATGRRNTTSVPISKLWMMAKKRRQHRALVLRPGQPEVTAEGELNTWQGYVIEPVPGDVGPFLRLYKRLLGIEQFPLLWIAHLVQHPGIKMFVALVIWSRAQGVGKNLLFEAVAALFNRRHWKLIDQGDVDDTFSGWIPDTVYAIADEVKVTHRDASRNKLNLWITSPVLRTHDKGQPKRDVENLINFVFLSNHADAMFLGDLDRRFHVNEVRAGPLPQSMIDEFIAWRDGGGLPHLMHYLMNVSLDGFDPKGRAPVTQAKRDMIEASRSDLDRWCYDIVSGAIPMPNEITTADALVSRFMVEYPLTRTPPQVATVGKVLVRMGAYARPNQVRKADGRKVRAIAIQRPEYWEDKPESAWREEMERKQ